jgi:orotidine-5'-phosphate decarboxylase
MNRSTLVRHIFERRSFLCVGLDPELSKLPPHLLDQPDPILAFNCAIVDATRDLCVAYKPNLAFYEALGPAGWVTFQKTVEYIGNQHFVIADAKRGDIGNTSRMYAQAFFEQLNCDAVTIAPYMGEDSVRPFLGFADRWAIVLALTSNAGSHDFQLTPQPDSEGLFLFEKVLRRCVEWGTPNNLMFVTGATHPAYFERVRAIAPDHFLLVPGVGAQGGDLQALCAAGLTTDCGLLVNSARSIIYASSGTDFAEKAREEAARLQADMAVLLSDGVIL